MSAHPFEGTPQYEQQYGPHGIGYPGNGLGNCEPAAIEEDHPLYDADTDNGLPFGWSIWTAPDVLSGFPGTTSYRPPETVENEDEIRLLFAANKRPVLVCGYCHQSYRTRKLEWALKWYSGGHRCIDDPEIYAATEAA